LGLRPSLPFLLTAEGGLSHEGWQTITIRVAKSLGINIVL